MQQAVSVLMLTKDDYLWQHWSQLDPTRWSAVRGQGIEDLEQWQGGEGALVLVDHALELWQDPRWTQAIRGKFCIVGSLTPNDTEGQAVLLAGARAYMHAYAPVATLQRVLEHVQAGEVWIGESLLSRLLSTISRQLPETNNSAWQTGLTTREVEVAQRAALGHGNQLIAEDLNITERTVRAHLSSVFEKLGVADRLMLTLKVHGVR